MNYTRVVEVLDQKSIESDRLAPRFESCLKDYRIEVFTEDSAGEIINIYAGGPTPCMKWLDSDKEKAMELGVSWPFSKLNPYECVIGNSFTNVDLKVGDTILIQL